MLSFFFFNDTATTEIYTLSLHDALPIYRDRAGEGNLADRVLRHQMLGHFGGNSEHQLQHALGQPGIDETAHHLHTGADRKSTRLNSSHSQISYAVFCLKKKK